LAFDLVLEQLDRIDIYLFLTNAILLTVYFKRDFCERVSDIGKDPVAILFLFTFFLSSIHNAVDTEVLYLASKHDWAIWPGRIVWYFGFSISDALFVFLFIKLAAYNEWVFTPAIKSIVFALAARSFLNSAAFIERFALGDNYYDFFKVAIPTVNVAITTVFLFLVIAHIDFRLPKIILRAKEALWSKGS
jgi:hypothetical protein